MTGEQLSTLVNIGSAGAVIAVVVLFLQFISKRDEDWRNFFTQIRQTDSEAMTRLANVIDKLTARVESLEDKFDRHDAAEMEMFRELLINKERKTQPRKST